MKALTIHQPYSSLIVGWDGCPPEILKRVENRGWYMRYRGPLLIHAGKSTKWLDSWDGQVPDDMPMGVVVGRADVRGCMSLRDIRVARFGPDFRWLTDHPHTEGPFCIVLERVQRLVTPIPATGKQRVWTPPDDVVTALDEAEWIDVKAPHEKD